MDDMMSDAKTFISDEKRERASFDGLKHNTYK